MLNPSQPIDPKYFEGLSQNSESLDYSDDKIKSQSIGKMFESLFEDNRKIGIGLRLNWLLRDFSNFFYDIKWAIRNHYKWRKIIRNLRPWEGFHGLITVMQTHLGDYIETEEKYGHAEEEYKKNKIFTAKETLEILGRMKNPDEYTDKRRNEVTSRYPDYKTLNEEYENGGSSSGGDFIEQSKGWAGINGGNEPQEGYFEFIDGRLKLAKSLDQNETNRLLAEIVNYNIELKNAYKQANIDFEKDIDRLGQLLKENLYTWWD